MKASKVLGTILVAGMLAGCSYTGDKYSVYFDSGSSNITMASKAALFKAAKMARVEGKKVKLSGFTDSTGSKKLNKKLSQKRIMSVSRELVKMGIAPMKITKHARGEGWFDTKGKNSHKKRRVEISVY